MLSMGAKSWYKGLLKEEWIKIPKFGLWGRTFRKGEVEMQTEEVSENLLCWLLSTEGSYREGDGRAYAWKAHC